MKRKFEIIDESEKYYRECPMDVDRSDIQEAFIEGAQWADKTMIEKAVEWIIEHIDTPYEGEFMFIDGSPVESDYIEWYEKRLEYAKKVANAFKQAMEE